MFVVIHDQCKAALVITSQILGKIYVKGADDSSISAANAFDIYLAQICDDKSLLPCTADEIQQSIINVAIETPAKQQ